MILTICAGCATVGVEKRLEPGDLPSLAGRWTGYLEIAGTPAHARRVVELTIHPDGSFVGVHAASRSEGRVAIVDGKAEFRAKTGPNESLSRATLYERNGKRILSGHGRSDVGPYSFEYEAVR